MEIREQISRIIERLPEAEAHATLRFVEYLSARHDPYLAQLLAAGEEHQELSEAGRRLVDEGFRALDAGESVPLAEVKREFGI